MGASLSSFGCFVVEIWVLRFRDLGASCFSLRFRVLRFRNYHASPQGAHTVCLCNRLHCYFIVNVLDLPSSSSVAAYLQNVYGSMLTKRCFCLTVNCRPLPQKWYFDPFWRILSSLFTVPSIKRNSKSVNSELKILQNGSKYHF